MFLPQGMSHAGAGWEPGPPVSLSHKAASPLQPQCTLTSRPPHARGCPALRHLLHILSPLAGPRQGRAIVPTLQIGQPRPERPKAPCEAAQRTSSGAGAHTQPAPDPSLARPPFSVQRSCLSAGVDYSADWSSAGYNVLMPPDFGGLSFTGSGDSLLESWASCQQSKSRAEAAS